MGAKGTETTKDVVHRFQFPDIAPKQSLDLLQLGLNQSVNLLQTKGETTSKLRDEFLDSLELAKSGGV